MKIKLYQAAVAAMLCLPSTTTAQDAIRFRDVDRNHDGVVSRDEWPGDDESFRQRDRNGDGVLSREEMNQGGRAVQEFSFYDFDGNGQVTRDEWIRAFTQLDMDGNGVLTREELGALIGGSGAVTTSSPAFEAGRARGLADGRQAGREDREQRNRWDLEGQRELEQADAGYRPDVGSREQYQAGYREGFRRGYAEGFGPRR